MVLLLFHHILLFWEYRQAIHLHFISSYHFPLVCAIQTTKLCFTKLLLCHIYSNVKLRFQLIDAKLLSSIDFYTCLQEERLPVFSHSVSTSCLFVERSTSSEVQLCSNTGIEVYTSPLYINIYELCDHHTHQVLIWTLVYNN